MKQTVKAVVLAVTTDHALYVCDAILFSVLPVLLLESMAAATPAFELDQ